MFVQHDVNKSGDWENMKVYTSTVKFSQTHSSA